MAKMSMRDAVRKRAEERQKVGGGGRKFVFPEGREVKFFKIDKPGKKRLDIIPYKITVDNHPVMEKDNLWYQRTIFTHNAIGADEKSYLCLKTIGKRCPICDARAALMKSVDADEELIKALVAKERELFNVIDLDNESAGVQLWEYSYHLFGKLLEVETREGDESYGDFAELKGGYTLDVRFKEKKMGKFPFFEADRIDFRKREDYDSDVLKETYDLDRILNVLPYDKLEAIFLEQEEEEIPKVTSFPVTDVASFGESLKNFRENKLKEEEEEEEVKPAPSRKRPAPTPTPTPAPVEEEEEEDDPLPPPTPPKRTRTTETAPKKKQTVECPGGGDFGVDCDEFDECFDCECWEDCKSATDKNK